MNQGQRDHQTSRLAAARSITSMGMAADRSVPMCMSVPRGARGGALFDLFGPQVQLRAGLLSMTDTATGARLALFA